MPELRDAKQTDAEAIARIYNASIAARDSTMQLEPVTAVDVETWIEQLSPREALLVLDATDAILGWGILKQYSDRGGYRFTGETSVYLQRDQTGRGYGSMLQEALIARSRSYDYHHLVAKIWATNEASLGLYRKFGFSMVGVQKEVGCVDGQWQDVAIMQKVLDRDDSC